MPPSVCTNLELEFGERGVLELDQPQDILEKHGKKEQRRNTPKQQMHEYRVAFVIAKPDAVPANGAGNGEKHQINDQLKFRWDIQKVQHLGSLPVSEVISRASPRLHAISPSKSISYRR